MNSMNSLDRLLELYEAGAIGDGELFSRVVSLFPSVEEAVGQVARIPQPLRERFLEHAQGLDETAVTLRDVVNFRG
jgi:hypothetical protein